jgi:hypothetical protein
MKPYEVFDRAEALRHLDSEPELLAEVASSFIDGSPGLVRELFAALESRSTKQLVAITQNLMGTLCILGAGRALGAANALDHAARSGNLEAAGPLCSTLAKRIGELVSALVNIDSDVQMASQSPELFGLDAIAKPNRPD